MVRVLKVTFVLAAMVAGTVTVAQSAAALPAAGIGLASAAVAPSQLGTSADTAAGSCWEIKQRNSAATDGDYWLLTPAMYEPQQFYCDMTTNGGGWVLIGKGRDGWNKNINAQGRTSDLLAPGMSLMGSTVDKYSGTTIDGLLNSQRVDALADGVRLKRAMDTAGTTWQEVQMNFSQKFGHWSWAFGALYPVNTWSFSGPGDSRSGSGGTTQNFGSNQNYDRVYAVPNSSTAWGQGFAYGSNVRGSSDSSSYVWSQGGQYAVPYTEVYVRPHITSDDPGFAPVTDNGTTAQTQASVAESDALTSPWGVNGTAGTTSVEGDVEVQAFAQSGDNMYVGGNFKYVQQDANGTGRVQQSFLAAFNIHTGQWVSSFRPALNEQVHALVTLPNGDIAAGGQFTQANGQPVTDLVALNPTTGATDPSWNVTVENRKTGGVVSVRALDVFEGYLYIGGDFTHLTGGPSQTPVYSSNIGRVDASTSAPSANWSGGLLNGGVNDISGGTVTSGSDRVYAAGFFNQSGTTTAQNAAAFETAAGAPVATPAWNPTWSNSNSYQRAVDASGSKIWVGGSEHSLFQFDSTTFDRTLGDIMYDKGDLQTVSDYDGVIYGGCHCNYYDYQNDYAWPTLTPDWTRADGMNWVGAWDANTGSRLPQFAPEMQSRLGSGVWATTNDSTGTLWVGGDITSASTATKRGAWAGGFARFALDDSTAPHTPANLHVTAQTSTTVSLAWGGVSDPSGVKYEVLRDDRPIASTSQTSVTVPKSTSGRFFVRAADGTGNVSASSPVLVVGTGQIPPSALFTWSANHSTVTVDASGSTSPDGTITDYQWDFGDGSGAHGETYSHTYSQAGDYIVTLTVTAGSGATASATKTVTAAAPPVNASPTDIYGRQVYQDGPWAYYRLGESTGATGAHDSGPDGRDGTYNDSSTIAFGTAGALQNSTDSAITTNGSSGSVSSPSTGSAPSTFTIEIWFKTASTNGGRLIGYGNAANGYSSNYDRHIYIRNDGRLVFGVYPGQEVEIVSPNSYNNGQWHMAVASLSATDGMKLYVDGALVVTNANGTAQDYVGYWRVGGDHLWDGASSNYLDGSIDEAAVFDHELTAQQIATEYTDGSTVVTPPVNQPPIASFTSTVSDVTAHFDASGSQDTDGTIVSYHWNFGDGATGNGQLIDHTFPRAGQYDVTLTVTDDGGEQDTIQQNVTTTAPPATVVAIPGDANWSYRFQAGPPPSDWNAQGFDASSWSSGSAVLGFGDSSVKTNVDTFAQPSDRPLAAYFIHSFQVADKSKVTKLVLDSVADDGVVLYVNGTEVNRTNMPAGSITYGTFASSAPRTSRAQTVTVTVPQNLLVDGTNVVAAETHLNYHATADITFHLSATLTTGGSNQAPEAAFTASMNELAGTFDASGTADPDNNIASYSWDFGDGAVGSGETATHTYDKAGTYTVALTVTDADGAVGTISKQVDATSPDTMAIQDTATWYYKYDAGSPPANWNTVSFDPSGWNSGPAVLGFGDPSVQTNIDTFASTADRPLAAYFTHQFQITDANKVSKLVLSTVADDGIVVYVNGTEVARSRMPSGTITDATYATSAVRTANAAPLVIDVPTSLLETGTNVISAETHLNFHKTPDITFHLAATLTQ